MTRMTGYICNLTCTRLCIHLCVWAVNTSCMHVPAYMNYIWICVYVSGDLFAPCVLLCLRSDSASGCHCRKVAQIQEGRCGRFVNGCVCKCTCIPTCMRVCMHMCSGINTGARTLRYIYIYTVVCFVFVLLAYTGLARHEKWRAP